MLRSSLALLAAALLAAPAPSSAGSLRLARTAPLPRPLANSAVRRAPTRALPATPRAGSARLEAARAAAAAAGFSAPPALAAAPAAPAGVPADPARLFSARAQELFAGRPLRPGQTLAVGWASRPGAAPESGLPSDEELRGRVARSPLTNAQRRDVLVELFKLGGAAEADIRLQDAGRGYSNVIVTKKGRTDRVIVVGAHYDKVSEGRGVIDNWSGTTLVANLYQALRGVDTEATIVFIGFAREEEGLIGSRQYVRSLSAAERDKIDAMVNLDTLAVDGVFGWRNNSTPALLARAIASGAESATLTGGDADSSSFRRAGIPAVTLFGASQDVIFDIIHTSNDDMGAFNFEEYKRAYLIGIDLLKSLDRAPLGPEGRRRV